MPASPRIGLCSVTFRALSTARVIELAAAAGLESIEWGGDVHVPPGDIETAEAVGAATRAAGLTVASLGSYLRFAEEDPEDVHLDADLGAVLETATALGADRIRIWAGSTGSAAISDADRRSLTDRIRSAAARAADRGLELALEFHPDTLTDSVASTRALLSDLDAGTDARVSSYWQPRIDASDSDALGDLDELASRVSTVHVFSWWPGHERQPLAARTELWEAAAARAAAIPTVTDLLLEFVPDDDPAVLTREVESLRGWRAQGFSVGELRPPPAGAHPSAGG